MYSYDQLFYEYQRKGSARSARAVLPHVLSALSTSPGAGVRSVLDVGCGAAAWLAEYEKLGISDVSGVDGDYVDRSLLLIDRARFTPHDISQPFDCHRQYDLVQCLEVGEHVVTERSGTLVDNIVRHGSHVLFSAAVPGQGGENHINERPYEFWRDLFKERGFQLFDFLRPAIQGNTEVEPWYRYNILFFARDDVASALPTGIAASRVPDGAAIGDFSPMQYRVQKAIMRILPQTAVSALAKVKHKIMVRSLQRDSLRGE